MLHFVWHSFCFQEDLTCLSTLWLLVGVSKKSLKVSGGIVSQAPLGRSYCPGQEASPACRYRMTRLYMQLPIDESEARQNLNIQKRPNVACDEFCIDGRLCGLCLAVLQQQVQHFNKWGEAVSRVETESDTERLKTTPHNPNQVVINWANFVFTTELHTAGCPLSYPQWIFSWIPLVIIRLHVCVSVLKATDKFSFNTFK